MPEQLSFWLPSAEAPAAAREPADASERLTALDPERSFIVQAPAGSGKTEILIQRYLTLLARVEAPESVVAITFTIKAAAEMRDRVLLALESASRPAPVAAHERFTWELARAVMQQDARRAWGLTRNAGRMRIQTIDALCMTIARQMPWLARMGAMPGVVEDARPFYDLAAEKTIRRLGEEGERRHAIERLLRHLDYNAQETQRLLAEMMEIRDHWLPVIGARPDMLRVRAVLEQHLDAIVRRIVSELHAAVPERFANELLEIARYAAGSLSDDHPLATCRELAALPETLAEWHGLRALLLTGQYEWRKSVNVRIGIPPGRMKSRAEQLLLLLQQEPGLLESLQSLRDAPTASYPEPQWRILEALFTLLPLCVADLRVIFSEHGRVDFIEIAQAARRALGPADDPTDLGLAMGCRVEHLLIDEFQDTSRGQYELLRALTAGWQDGDRRSLFLVGDPMQAIYRFRQADVGLYLSIRERGLGELLPEALTLSANFRSAPAIVEWVNATFEKAFPGVEDAARGGVPYTRSIAFRGSDSQAGVFVYPFFERQDAEEATRVLQLIEQERAAGGKVAILVRARTHLIETADLLRRQGIRFRAIEIDSLGERPVVQDLLALTRALLHLADRPSWLAILRAPWCGLTLADLYSLAGSNEKAAIWDLLRSPEAALSADGAQRAATVIAVMERALAIRGRAPLRSVVEGAWRALGGPECLENENDFADAHAYLDLLEQQERGGELEDLEGFTRKVDDLFAQSDPAAPETLDLMTVHKAKGLEFDSVIVPGLGKPPKRDDSPLLLWSERPDPENPQILMAAISAKRADEDPIYRHLKVEERAKGAYETVRLLYVACTRARRTLHLLGHVCLKEVDGVAQMREPESVSFLGVIWHAVKDQFEAKFRDFRPAATAPDEGRNPQLRRVLNVAAPVFPPLTVATTSGGTVTRVSDAEARRLGVTLHRVIEQIGKDGLDAWSPERVRGLKAITGGGLVEAALLKLLADERGRWILGHHAETRNELEIASVESGDVRSVRVDRTFVDQDGVLWIVDFKTGNLAEGHVLQVNRYARMLRAMDARPIRAGLYSPFSREWRSWDPLAINGES